MRKKNTLDSDDAKNLMAAIAEQVRELVKGNLLQKEAKFTDQLKDELTGKKLPTMKKK